MKVSLVVCLSIQFSIQGALLYPHIERNTSNKKNLNLFIGDISEVHVYSEQRKKKQPEELHYIIIKHSIYVSLNEFHYLLVNFLLFTPFL